MKKIIPPKSALLSTFLLTTCFLVLLSIALELSARTVWAKKTFPYRSMGIPFPQMEIKWFHLEQYVQEHGGVDVIIMGSSLANTGVDPDVIENQYEQETGIRPRVFNFGLEGLTISPEVFFSELLIRKYHPAALVVVTEMRDYAAQNGSYVDRQLRATPWTRYQMGYPDMVGWLIDRSEFLQHYLFFRNWNRADFFTTNAIYQERYTNTTASGYERDNAIDKSVSTPPDPNNPDDASKFAAYHDYQADPERLEDLKYIISLARNNKMNIVIVEMPVHPSFYDYVGGDGVHVQFQRQIASLITSEGGSYIPSDVCASIPIDGYANRVHLNFRGAPLFSACIGEQMVLLTAQKGMNFVRTTADGSK